MARAAPLPLLLLWACAPSHTTADAGQHAPEAGTPRVGVSVSAVDTRFDTRDHMMAAIEMQLSGEPLAEAMGRDLGGFDRNVLPPDRYQTEQIDLAGYSAAVESYEYSKQPMNLVAFESGAGVSLAAGPVLNPTALAGTDATQFIQDAVQKFGWAARATTLQTFDSGLGSAHNPVGWPGFWPTLHPWRSFDPTMHPTDAVAWRCSLTGDESSTRTSAILFEDYECDYNSLHLADREAQVEKVITPGASGWADWKYSLWAMNYLQILHDALENPIRDVNEEDLSEVGLPNNLVRGNEPNTVRGIFLGSSNVEGFQAGFLLTTMDNQFEHWLRSLTTTDGTSLSGFPDLMSALRYDFAAPLRWIPSEIAVAERDDGVFPRATGYTIQSSESRLIDLLGLLGGAATTYALTDLHNAAVGGSLTVRPWFDGDPFPADNQLPDGESTLHDRSLALIRFLIVTLDRLHADASSQLVDLVSFNGSEPVRGQTIETASVAYSLAALRQARRAITSQLGLYSNNTPDSASVPTILDSLPFDGAPGNASFARRLNLLIDTQAQLLLNRLTDESGRAWSGWNVPTQQPVDQMDRHESAHTAAGRGLLTAYLASGDTRYRERALVVFRRMDQVFFDPATLLYTSAPQPMDEVVFTPRRFGLLQGTLRDLFLLVGSRPGHEELGTLLLQRLARLNKLILNGWDDLNGNQVVDWPGECIRVEDELPRGGLQMAERGLTGETGSLDDSLTAETRVTTTDREQDCVPDITAAHLPATLAHEIRVRRAPQ